MAAAAVAAAVAGSILAALPAISMAAPEWKVALATASTAESAANTQPAAPTGVTTACATTVAEVTVTWDAVSDASTYTIYDSTSSATGPYASYATGVTGTSYTTAALSKSTDYWFEVSATVGASWTSPDSAAGAVRKLSSGDKCS